MLERRNIYDVVAIKKRKQKNIEIVNVLNFIIKKYANVKYHTHTLTEI